jgi:hypothetical protein
MSVLLGIAMPCFTRTARNQRTRPSLVQTTTADHLAHRLTKIKALAELPGLLAAGCKVQVHGWKRRGQ